MSSLYKLISENKDNGSVDRILGTLSGSTVPSESLPVDVDKDAWIKLSNPERISRKFSFSGKLY